jgi:hypothetical protein
MTSLSRLTCGAALVAAVLSLPAPAAAQQWFGTPADVFWTPAPNRPDILPPGINSLDPVARCRAVLRFTAQFHAPIDGALNACPMLAAAVEWEDEPGSLQPYLEWPIERKDQLNEFFQRLLNNQSNLGLSCPNTNVAMVSGGRVYLTEEQAFGIYAAHVAHALYLEAARRVPWSIVETPREELRILFASPSYFVRLFGKLPSDAPSYLDPARAFTLPERVIAGDGLVCDPRVGYRFLSGASSTAGENLIGATEEETLARIGVWMTRDVGHGGIPEDFTLEHERQYSYLQDRLKARTYWPFTMAIMTAGCHSAASFIHDLAKSVNIPLLPVLAYEKPRELWPPHEALQHQGLLYHWARKDLRVLWHADDFYRANQLGPYFPIDAAGRRLASGAALRLFFDVNFVPPDVLTVHEFEWFTDWTTFPETSPGPFFFSEPIVGTWQPPALPFAGYLWDKRYDLCTWVHFVQRQSAGASFDVLQDFTNYGPWTLSHPLESFGPRADACAAAYGGYDALAAAVSAFEAGRGSNLYSTAPVLILPPGLRLRFPL